MNGSAADMVPDGVSDPLVRQRRSLDLFAAAIVISLVLHLAASVVVVLPGRLARTAGAPLMLELQNLQELPEAPQGPLPEPAAPEEPEETGETVMSEPAPAMAQLEQAMSRSLRRAVEAPAAVHESAIGLGMVSGRFASFAEGATLKDDIKTYYFTLMRRINEVWWTSAASASSFSASASVNIVISRSGRLLACELLESSGSSEQDGLLLAVIRKAEPLPPLPADFREPTFSAPIRFVPPLRLMVPEFGTKRRLSVNHGE